MLRIRLKRVMDRLTDRAGRAGWLAGRLTTSERTDFTCEEENTAIKRRGASWTVQSSFEI